MKKFIFLILITTSVYLTGCGYISENTLKEVLEKDPSFKEILNAKKRLDAKILALEDKKDNLDVQISFLKQEANPHIQALKAKLEKAGSEYNLKKKNLKNSISSLKSIRKLLEKKSKLLLTGDEISVWKKRIGSLEKEISSLRSELDRQKSQTRLLKTELKILKQ